MSIALRLLHGILFALLLFHDANGLAYTPGEWGYRLGILFAAVSLCGLLDRRSRCQESDRFLGRRRSP